MTLPSGWQRIHQRRYERRDGAVVKWDEDTPYSNPLDPNARMFTVWEPDPGTGYLGKRIRGRRPTSKVPRRYKTPEAAMRAANKAWPMRQKE